MGRLMQPSYKGEPAAGGAFAQGLVLAPAADQHAGRKPQDVCEGQMFQAVDRQMPAIEPGP